MRIREEQREQIRYSLLQAGMELIGERGLAETTIEEITSRAGVAKGTFYNYFRTKADLVRAAVTARQESWRSELQRLNRTHPSVRDRLHEVSRRFAEWVTANPEIAWVWSLERLRRLGAAGADEPPGVFHQILAGVFGLAQESGEVRPDRSVEELALDYQGIVLVHFGRWYAQMQAGGDQADLALALRQAVDTYLHGALKERGKG